LPELASVAEEVAVGDRGVSVLIMSEGAQFFFNTATGQVEETENRSQSKDLLGPYPTREAAAAALETARKRTEDWDEQERRYREGE
jgi:hypothetical protein